MYYLDTDEHNRPKCICQNGATCVSILSRCAVFGPLFILMEMTVSQCVVWNKTRSNKYINVAVGKKGILSLISKAAPALCLTVCDVAWQPCYWFCVSTVLFTTVFILKKITKKITATLYLRQSIRKHLWSLVPHVWNRWTRIIKESLVNHSYTFLCIYMYHVKSSNFTIKQQF